MPKKAAKEKTAKKKAARSAVPYAQIAKLAQGGADALTIAKKIGRVNDGEDKTHTVRAIISGMRTRGWKDESGKLQKLKVDRVGKPKTKAVQKAAKKPTKKTPSKPTAFTQHDGKTVSAGAE